MHNFLFRTKIEFKNPKREKLDNKMIRHSGYYTQMEITQHKARMSTTTILYNIVNSEYVRIISCSRQPSPGFISFLFERR